jgi:mono/diheme cytochrome c family protein
MKDLALWLGLVSAPAIIFAIFGPPGLEAFREPRVRLAAYAVEEGRIVFAARCARCHGRLAEGTERGPRLVGSGEGLRGAAAARFRRILRGGVPAGEHHGGMPAFPDLPDAQVDGLLAFLRRLERAEAAP